MMMIDRSQRAAPRASIPDRRTSEGRRWTDLYHAYCDQLGGEHRLMEGTKQMLRRAASLSVAAEVAEAALAKGQDVDVAELSRLAERLRRLLVDLGLLEKAQLPPPTKARTLEEYVASKYGGHRAAPGCERELDFDPVQGDVDDGEPVTPRRRASTIRRHKIPLTLPGDEEDEDE